jgi:hypothetical protein
MMYQHGRQLGPTSIQNFTLGAGVILPAIAITVEATTNLSARMFLDPIPTGGHLLLVMLVPLTQLQVWYALRRNDPTRVALAGVANSVAIATSLFYSLVYLPLLPVAALTLLIAVGILLLAPFFALVSALIMRKQLKQLAAIGPRKKFPLTTKRFLAGLALTGGVIGLLEVPPALTRYGLQMATSGSPEIRARGIRYLREYGSQDYLLRRCYDDRVGSLYLLSNIFSDDRPIKTDEVREIYYRVTGENFDASPPPRRIGSRQILQPDLEIEEQNDGSRTTGIFKNLSLSSSNLNGSFDPDGGVGHLDWVLGFDNGSPLEREVRAEIQLPPGGVVSSVTQTVGSIERTTEFFGRSTATVTASDDDQHAPVLVTTAGRDRVLFQYPVPALSHGATVHIGISVPLVLQSKEQARLILPHFNDRNFHVSPSLKHWILIDSTHPLTSDLGLSVHTTARSKNMGYQMWGGFSEAELMRPETALRLSRTPTDYGIWSHNPFEVDGAIVKQSLEERAPSYLRRVVVVVDTSISMAQWKPQILAALSALRSDMDVQLVMADGDWRYKTDKGDVLASGLDNAYTLLSRTDFVGGADNAPALSTAWDLATAIPGNNAIVWIHSPQRTSLESIEPLIFRWESRFYGPSLYAVQTTAGSDEIEKKLDGIDEVKSVVRLGSLRTDLERLFSQLSGTTPTLQFVRSVKAPTPNMQLEGVETSDHLARLWANDEVARILSARDNSLREAATMLSLRYQLVTPASGAVIRENTQSAPYIGDLKPKEVTTFTFVQQPDLGSLLFLGLIFFVWLVYMKTRGANSSGSYTS